MWPELLIAHVAGSAGGVVDDHHLADPELVDGYKEGTYGRVGLRGDDTPGVLDDLGVTVPESEGLLQKDGESGVHSGEDGEFLRGVLVRDERLVGLLGNELSVILEDFVYHNLGRLLFCPGDNLFKNMIALSIIPHAFTILSKSISVYASTGKILFMEGVIMNRERPYFAINLERD